MTTRKGLTLLTLTAMLLLNSCMVGPNYTRPKLSLPQDYLVEKPGATTESTPTQFGGAQQFVAKEHYLVQWWTLFHSKALNDLIITSVNHHPSVEVAQQALRSALETVAAQKGSFYPSIGLSFTPTNQQVATLLTSALSSNKDIYALYTGQVFVSYTADVFGGMRRQVESLIAQAKAQQLQLEATYLTLSSNVVNAAIQEAALREQIKITKHIIASQIKILAIMRQQKQLGDTSTANLALQEASLASSQATLPPLEKQLAVQRDLLNALTGRYPADKRTPTFTFNALQLPSQLPLSLPSSLLEHRPDIRAAEEAMHGANALIGVAVANRLPKVSIDATGAGFANTQLNSFFQPYTRFWNLAGIISQPIFSGGMLLHQQRAAEALYQQAVGQYKLTVINAFQNVADSLNALKQDALALKRTNQLTKASLHSLTISREQLKAGDISILTLITNEQRYWQAQLNLIQCQANRLSDTVALFQALGGGWWEP